MARLPNPGSDDGSWGTLLNQFLSVEHDSQGNLVKLADIDNWYEKTAGGILESEFSGGVQAKLNTPPSTDVGDGTVTDVKVAADAAIAQSKIANLAFSLSQRMDTNDSRLSDARTIMAKDGVSTGPKRKNLEFIAGVNMEVDAVDNAAGHAMDTIFVRIPNSTDITTWVNVKDYGAVGNQATDDTSAFQAAIAHLKSQGGGVMYVPRGVYLITGQMEVDGIHVIGEGAGATTLYCSEVGSSTTFGCIFDMQPDGTNPNPGSIQRLNMNGPGQGGATQNGIPTTWTHGIRACRGAVLRDISVGGFYTGVYLQYGKERFENARIGNCFFCVYFTGSTKDTGGQYFRNSEIMTAPLSCIGASPTGALFDVVFSGMEFGLAPFGFYKEGPPGGTFINGLTMLQCVIEYGSNGYFYAPGQVIENVSMVLCNSWALLGFTPFTDFYPAEAGVVCGTMRNWQILSNNPFGWYGSDGVIKCDNMSDVYMDWINYNVPNKPYIVCPNKITGADLRAIGLRMRPMIATTPLVRGDLVEADVAGKCKRYTNGILVGICMSGSVAVGEQALVAFESTSSLEVRVAVPGTMARLNMKYLKPDPNNSGCAIEASGPQDVGVFGMNIADVSNGKVVCTLSGVS